MKRRYKQIAFLFALLFIIILASCADSDDTYEKITEEHSKVKGITIVLDPAGGELTGDESYTFVEGELPYLPDPIRKGYEFIGWDKDISALESDAPLTAVWKKKQITVEFDLCGGESNTPELLLQTVDSVSDIQLPSVYRENYEFVSWSQDVLLLNSDAVISANWSLIPLTSEEVYAKCIGACVELQTYDKSDIRLYLGSGFIISSDGIIVTAAHVIKGAANIEVKLNGGAKYFVENIIACDFDRDIAIIKINATDLPFLELSCDDISKGMTVYAIGSPNGRTGEMTSGEITRYSFVYDREGFIISTTHIESGSSGGPLVDSRGRVVGINSAVSVLSEEYLAVRIAEIYSLSETNENMETFSKNNDSFSDQTFEKENNDIDSSVQKMDGDTIIRGTVSNSNDTDVYRYEGAKKVMFMVSVEAENRDFVGVDCFSAGEKLKSAEGFSRGISGKYHIINRTVTVNAGEEIYIKITAPEFNGMPIAYSLRAIVIS